jgi:hypothetical protein
MTASRVSVISMPGGCSSPAAERAREGPRGARNGDEVPSLCRIGNSSSLVDARTPALTEVLEGAEGSGPRTFSLRPRSHVVVNRHFALPSTVVAASSAPR